MHLAAEGGYEEVAELLLTHGAEVNAKDNEGDTPFSDAISFGHEHMAEWLTSARQRHVAAPSYFQIKLTIKATHAAHTQWHAVGHSRISAN
ncbi:MAG: ankyrin repeat domain-containing protein [Candidatus Angelobacter sp.]